MEDTYSILLDYLMGYHGYHQKSKVYDSKIELYYSHCIVHNVWTWKFMCSTYNNTKDKNVYFNTKKVVYIQAWDMSTMRSKILYFVERLWPKNVIRF